MAGIRGVSFGEVREIALALPGVEDAISYGAPSLRVARRFLARLREDGDTVALQIPFDERDLLLQADPEAFLITDHYAGYPAIVIRLSDVSPDQVRDVLEIAWRARAPKRLIAEYDARVTGA